MRRQQAADSVCIAARECCHTMWIKTICELRTLLIAHAIEELFVSQASTRGIWALPFVFCSNVKAEAETHMGLRVLQRAGPRFATGKGADAHWVASSGEIKALLVAHMAPKLFIIATWVSISNRFLGSQWTRQKVRGRHRSRHRRLGLREVLRCRSTLLWLRRSR